VHSAADRFGPCAGGSPSRPCRRAGRDRALVKQRTSSGSWKTISFAPSAPGFHRSPFSGFGMEYGLALPLRFTDKLVHLFQFLVLFGEKFLDGFETPLRNLLVGTTRWLDVHECFSSLRGWVALTVSGDQTLSPAVSLICGPLGFCSRRHLQSRISGMSSPCLQTQCLCSISLSRRSCLR